VEAVTRSRQSQPSDVDSTGGEAAATRMDGLRPDERTMSALVC